MIRLLFILLLAFSPAKVLAEDISAPPETLKSPEVASEERDEKIAEPETTEDAALPAADDKAPAPAEEEPAPPAEDKEETKAEHPTAIESAGEDIAAEGIAAEPVKTPEPLPPPPAPRKWETLQADSIIRFSGVQMGKDFEGVIKAFTADILFDDANLVQSKVAVDIDLLSLDAQDEERNKTVKGGEWLDVAKFPSARFETKTITKTEDGSYIADATLTIHGVSQPLQLPFSLGFSKVEKGVDKGKDLAVMTGKVVLDRSKFQLGQGEWEDPSIIANEISVEVRVSAVASEGAADQALPATP